MMTSAAATHSIRWKAATTPAGTTVWRTPPALYSALDQEFAFTLDVAADEDNAQCDRFFDREADALGQTWAGESVFCNPPYGRDLERWLRKAETEARDNGATVVMVLPARTGNRWFHRYVLGRAEVRFIEGRLGFTLGGAGRARAPFDSMVVVFYPGEGGCSALRAQPTFPGFPRN